MRSGTCRGEYSRRRVARIRSLALLPEIDFDQANYRASLKSVFDQHNMGSGSMTFDNFYTAQLLWDETMAQRVAEVMNAPDAPKTMVVLAGSGHIRYGFGIPQRAARRGAEPYQTVLPVLLDHLDVPLANLAADNIADYLWVMSADERKLPRLGPHPHPTSQPSSRPVTASR
ncbi:MAG: ChaN family lipoprotein [Planctomycetota bacterium]